MDQMTDIRPDVETVTVTFEEMKKDLGYYLSLKEHKRLVVTHEGEQIAVLGPRLPDEQRILGPKFWWFLDYVAPPMPADPDDPYSLTHALEEVRGYRPFT